MKKRYLHSHFDNVTFCSPQYLYILVLLLSDFFVAAARRYRALHVPVSSSFSRYTNTHARSGSFKRSDPVARFQQFQNQWKRDKFLQSQEAPRRLEYRYNLGMWIPEI